MPKDIPQCDKCSAPATMSAINVFRHEMPDGAEWAVFLPFPSIYRKWGCDAHPVTSEERLTKQPPPKD